MNDIYSNGCNYPIPYKFSKYLVYSSCIFSVSSINALYIDDTTACIYFLFLFLTSINFWKKPDYGARRNIDKLFVYIGVLYFASYVYLLKTEFYKKMYLYLFICVLWFNILEHILCYFNSPKWIIVHMTMHIYTFFMSLFIFVL